MKLIGSLKVPFLSRKMHFHLYFPTFFISSRVKSFQFSNSLRNEHFLLFFDYSLSHPSKLWNSLCSKIFPFLNFPLKKYVSADHTLIMFSLSDIYHNVAFDGNRVLSIKFRKLKVLEQCVSFGSFWLIYVARKNFGQGIFFLHCLKKNTCEASVCSYKSK